MMAKMTWQDARRAVEQKYELPTAESGLATGDLFIVPLIRPERVFNDVVIVVVRSTGQVHEADRRDIPDSARKVS